MSQNDRMTARGSSPIHEAPTPEAVEGAGRYICAMVGYDWALATEFQKQQYFNGAREILRRYAVDLPSLCREAAAQALEEAAMYLPVDCQRAKASMWLRARAASLREGNL